MHPLEEKLRHVFAKALGLQPSDVSAGSSPATIRTWDSLRHVELILAIEDAFGVVFDAAEVFGLTTFGGIHAQLATKLGAPAPITP